MTLHSASPSPQQAPVAKQEAQRSKGLKKLEQRCGLLGHSHSSCARRASGWNTYGSQLTLYPSHAVLPGPRERWLMTRHLATALVRGKGKWCPLVVYTALGPLFGIRGGPRCPVATARTTGALCESRLQYPMPGPRLFEAGRKMIVLSPGFQRTNIWL